MAETEKKPDQEQLKKQARRRLVGASAFALLSAIVLPTVMDKTPQPIVHDIDVRIPGQEDKPAVHPAAVPPVPPAMPVPPASPNPGTPDAVAPFNPMQPAPGVAPAVLPPATLPAAPAPAVAGGATPSLGAGAGRMTPPVAPPLPPDVLQAAPRSSSAAKDQESRERDGGKAEKDREKDKDKDKGKKEKEGKGEADRASAILSGKAEKADKAGTADGSGSFVILLGAFSNEANARNLRDRLSAQGIKTYSESLNTPQGNKVRVRVGPFNDRDKAEKVLEKLRGMGVSGAIAGK